METDRIISILAKTFSVKESDLTPELKMEEADWWDSLSHMEMIADLESEFGLEFTSDEIMQMISIDAVSRIVKEKLINDN